MKFTSFMKSSALKGVGAVSLSLALAAGLVGCGGSGGAVAATVNGQDIMEQTVTDYVADFREKNGLETDEAWGKWMVANNYTPEKVREEVIEYYVKMDLYDQAAAEFNVAVEQADIDAAMEQTKASFADEETFTQSLEASGMTEEEYIEDYLRPQLLESKLSEAVAASENKTGDDALLAQAQSMADQMNGAKRSSHILLVAEGDETDEELQARAQALLDQINAGEISFEDAATQNSQDQASAVNGGDAGWDLLNNFVTEYAEAVASLNKDEITPAPVKTEYGYHIIKVTDVFEVPEGGITSIDQVPEEFVVALQSMQAATASQDFVTWFEEYRENADVVINPMPEGLPYAIDLAPYEDAAAADQTTTEGETSTDPTAQDATQADATGEGAEGTDATQGETQGEGDATQQGEGDATQGDTTAQDGTDATQGETQGDDATQQGETQGEGDATAQPEGDATQGETGETTQQ